MSSLKSSNSSDNESDAHGDTTRVAVTPEDEGSRLDRLLATQPGIVSREMARRLILQGEVELNETSCTPSSRVKSGDRIAYRIPPPEPVSILPEPFPLRIIHEDAALIVIDKPVNMPMHPGPGHRTGTLVNHLLAHCTDLSGIGGALRPGIVHRLDKDTSGVVVSAKTDRAHHHLSEQFKARTTRRSYLALAVGKPRENRGAIDLPLSRDRVNRLRRSVARGGKDIGQKAVTHWRVSKRLGPFTLFELKLETGRTHQIRVHLAEQGWPVLGDPLYGQNRHRGLVLPPELAKPLEALQGQVLHAAELGFVHPETGEAMIFRSPLPESFVAVLTMLETAYGDSKGNDKPPVAAYRKR